MDSSGMHKRVPRRLVQSAEQAKVLRWLGIGMVAAGIMTVGGIALDPSSLADFAPPVVMILGGLAGAIRAPRCGAALTDEGVTVVNPLKEEQLRWEDIHSFSLGRYGPYPEMGFVELNRGGRIHIWGIQSKNPLFTRDQGAMKLVDELNEELGEYQLHHRGD